MLATTSLVAAVLPGVFGGLLVSSIPSLRKAIPLPLLFALGIFPGFWMLSVYVDLTKMSQVPIASDFLLRVYFFMVMGLLLGPLYRVLRYIDLGGLSRKAAQLREIISHTQIPNIFFAICCGGFILFLVMLSQHINLAPISAWDVLGSWSFHGRQVIDQAFIEGAVVSYGDHQSHPTAATTLLGWASWASQSNGAVALWPWLLAAVGIWAAIVGYAMHRGQTGTGCLIATLVVCSPLLENHIGLAGYSEIWLTLTMLTATAVLAVGLSLRSVALVLFALVASLMCIWTRKTGLANTLILVSALIVTCIFMADGIRRWPIFAVLVALIAWGVHVAFSFGVAGANLEWDPGINTLHFAGRDLKIQWQGILQIAHNELYSKFINMSFSTLFTAGFICSVFILFTKKNNYLIDASQIFVVIVFVSNITLLFLTQLLSVEGMNLGAVNSDTGISRFSLPALAITGLLAVDACSCISNQVTENGDRRPS